MKFMKIFLAALLAVIVAGILSTMFWLIVLIGFSGSLSSEQVVVSDNSILKINLQENITDSPVSDPFSGISLFSMDMIPSLSLYKALQSIDAAKHDDRIKGIYINPDGAGTIPLAAMEEIRAALVDFKSSGKFVVTYSDTYTQGLYYLASVSDKIYMQPKGSFSWSGLAQTSLFFKGMFDKLGLEYEIYRPTSCKYKSAVEPYFLKKMSDANREQNEVLLNTMWSEMLEDIMQSRSFSGVDYLNKLADELLVTEATDALEYKMVDALIYEDEMEGIFEELGVERGVDEQFNIVTLGEYSTQLVPNIENIGEKQVAIVYADGAIMDGEGEQSGTIFGDILAKKIKEVRLDDEVAAVVLRVNSPGGSALASDVIWREMKLLQQVKPVVVSMGEYAASGGYYISCPADAILADRFTLTGSIGVFGAFPIAKDFYEDKLGLTFDGVKTNRSADFGQGFLLGAVRPSTASEKRALLRMVDRVYETFTGNVSEGRNLPIERVLEIAEGRVWSGVSAKEIGLIDDFGGLNDAIAVAAAKAGLEKYCVEERLVQPEGFAAILSQLNARIKAQVEMDALGLMFKPYERVQEVLSLQGVLMYSPYSYDIE